ncbi:unnamed protein product [Caenorhabditis brenneri]
MNRRPFAELNPDSEQDLARQFSIAVRHQQRPRIDDVVGWFPPPAYSDAEDSGPDESDSEPDFENRDFYPDYATSGEESDEEEWELEDPDFYPDYPESESDQEQEEEEEDINNNNEDESGEEEDEIEPQNDEEGAENAAEE